MARSQVRSMCRVCHMCCPIIVDVDEGVAVAVRGDPEGEVHHGYTCVKGRQLPSQLRSPERLLHSLKRTRTGSFEPVAVQAAMDEIAERLSAIIAEDGPLAVANYVGTMAISSALTIPFQNAFARALGGRPCFTAATIDQPGKSIAKGFHGMWGAPAQGLDDADVSLLIGTNPLVSNAGGLSLANPQRWLRHAKARGLTLIVIDPRRTETASQADLFLQPRPGEDIAIVASLLRTIIEEDLFDADFIRDEVNGFAELRRAVAPFDAEMVARRADVLATDLRAAARTFACAQRGTALAGTGPSMSSGRSTLLEYLMLCLNTICGRWLRAGERLWNPGTVVPPLPHVAQAIPPFRSHGMGVPSKVRGLGSTIAGPPTATLPEDILAEGEGRVRALVSCAGNPVAAWPDETLVREAIGHLDLFVQVDPWMSAAASMADYVIAPKLSLETASTTTLLDMLIAYAPGIGVAAPWGQYTPAVVEPPPGSDVIPEWEFFYGLASRMGLELHLKPFTLDVSGGSPVTLDTSRQLSEDELLDLVCRNARIPLAVLRQNPGGGSFYEPSVVVDVKEAGWQGRLDVGNQQMLHDLSNVLSEGSGDRSWWAGDGFPFRLICRRIHTRYNSTGHTVPRLREMTPHNAAHLNPLDLDDLGLRSGEEAEITSTQGRIVAVVEADPTMRRGCVSMAHGWSDIGAELLLAATSGAPTSRLSDLGDAFDPYSGQPLMSNIPVRLQRLHPTPTGPWPVRRGDEILA